MKETLSGLIELQNVDQELQALDELKGDLPQRVEQIKRKLDAGREELESLKSELTEVKKTHALRESDLNGLQDKLNKSREQLYAVTSNREYDAITVEIDTIKEKISQAEDEILEMIEREEQISARVNELQPQLSEFEQELADRQKELEQKIQATENEYQAYLKQREQLLETIKRPALYQYERIRKGLGNSAVATVQSSACSACFSSLPPQKIVEIKMMNRLIHCESCGRILVYSEVQNAMTN